MTNDYRNLTDEGIEAHDASLREQMMGLVAERTRRRKATEQANLVAERERHRKARGEATVLDAQYWDAWTLGMVANNLAALNDAQLQSLVVAWSTHGSKIEAELAKRAEAHRKKFAVDLEAVSTPMPDGVKFFSFADMLKEHNPGLDDAGADRLLKDIDDPPSVDHLNLHIYDIGNEEFEDFSMFTSGELVLAGEGLMRQRAQALSEGDIYEARRFDAERKAVLDELDRREESNT